MDRSYRFIALAGRLPLAAFLVLASFVAAAKPDDGERMRRLASERGCTLCHREAPSPREADSGAALAPSWREIAARYRGRDDAEEVLTRTVMEGADPAVRHWKNRMDFTVMRGNEGNIAPGEARSLVRWILSSP